MRKKDSEEEVVFETAQKRDKKPMTKKKKIIIISSVTVAVLILGAICGVLIWAFSGNGHSAKVDDSVINIERPDDKYYLGTQGNLAAGGGNVIITDFAFTGATDFSVDESKAEIKKVTIGNTDRQIIKPLITSGEFDIKFTQNDKKTTLTVVIVEGGYNIYERDGFVQAFGNDIQNNNIILQSNIDTATSETLVIEENMTVNGNGFILDATSISGKAQNTVFQVRGNVVANINNIHIIGENIQNTETDKKDITLDEFEGNGAIFDSHGDGTAYPTLNIDHCLVENGHKLAWISSSKVTITNSIFRNASDAIIAVQTTTRKGAELNMTNNILSNSVVAGVLFCGWDDVSANAELYRCTMNIDGFLDIYNWKDTNTTKLVPNTEGYANLVNNMVGAQIKSLIKDENAVKKYMVVEDNQHYIQIGIIRLATGNFAKNETVINGMDKIGFELRDFPIPEFAKIIAKSCDLISYTQESAGAKDAIGPKDTIATNIHLEDIGFSI